MMTFLEFYEQMMKFCMFKLYSDANMTYPPNVDWDKIRTEDFSYTHLSIDKLNVEGED